MNDTYANKKISPRVHVSQMHYAKYVVFVVAFALALSLWLHPNLAGADFTRYLYWTRSLFFDQDLLLINEFEMFGERLLLTPTGYAQEFHNFGTAIFWLPFYAVAYLIDRFIIRSDAITRTGYEAIYILLINFSTWIYAGITLLLMYQLVGRYSSGKAAFWAIVFIALGTSFFYYVVFLPVSSHIVSALLATIFLIVWDMDRHQQSRWQLWLVLGIIGGGLLLVANYNLPYLFLPLFTGLNDVYQNGFQRYQLKLVVIYPLFIFLTFVPQLFVWWLYFGSPLASPYSDQLSWFDFHKLIFLTWFSGWHGLFVFSPIIFLSLVGLYYLFKRDKLLAASIVFIFLAFSYIVNANSAWPAGTSFGARYFISLAPILAISLAILLHRFENLGLYGLAGTLSLWTILLYAQTTLGLMNMHTWYPLDELVRGQWPALQQLPALIYQVRLPATAGFLFRVVLGLAVAAGVIGSVGPWLVKAWPRKFNDKAFLAWPSLVIILIILVWSAGMNSRTAQNRLAAKGYYQGKQLIYVSDPLDAMKNYRNLAEFYLAHRQPERAEAILQAAIQGWPNQIRQFIRSEMLPQLTYHPLNLNFGDVVRLVGYSLIKTEVNNLKVNLYWQRLAARIDEVSYTFSLVDYVSDRKIAQYQAQEALIRASVMGVYPIEHIPDGIYFSDTFDLPYQPDNIFGKVNISMAESGLYPRLPDGSAPESVTIVFIDLSAASNLLSPLNYNFDNKMVLTGYRTHVDKTRQTLSLALLWRVIDPPPKDYKLFTHIVDSNHNIITQRDGEPLSGLRPTSTWKPGEEILDLYDISLPPGMPLETATIELGFYLLETGERLFLVNPNTISTTENSVRLEIR